jgi:mannosyl-3-phosphoglycerate phosphatase family protein
MLVFTDLDGTLLDHHHYNFEPARLMIARLKKANIPIIPVTSKTKVEVVSLMRQLDLHGPFIIENGAAVLIPSGYFSKQPEGTLFQKDYWVHVLSESRQKWVNILAQMKPQFPEQFTSFTCMTHEEIAKVTGLSIEMAHLAACREYSEPIVWLGDQIQKIKFKQRLSELGNPIVEGGRFMHFTVDTNKGIAVRWLLDCFKSINEKHHYYSIALGDGENDLSMFNQVDQAILIRSPNQPPLKVPEQDNLIISEKMGPEAWSEELEKLSKHWDVDLSQ